MAKKTISYSQFALWCQCPYSWKLQYVDKALPWTDNIHTLFGTSMHEVLQEYIRVMYKIVSKKPIHFYYTKS